IPSSFPVRNESEQRISNLGNTFSINPVLILGARKRPAKVLHICSYALQVVVLIVFVDWRFHGFRVVIVKRKSFEDIFSSVPQDDGHKALVLLDYSPIEIHQSTRRHGYDKIIRVLRQDLLQHHPSILTILMPCPPFLLQKRDMGVEICF